MRSPSIVRKCRVSLTGTNGRVSSGQCVFVRADWRARGEKRETFLVLAAVHCLRLAGNANGQSKTGMRKREAKENRERERERRKKTGFLSFASLSAFFFHMNEAFVARGGPATCGPALLEISPACSWNAGPLRKRNKTKRPFVPLGECCLSIRPPKTSLPFEFQMMAAGVMKKSLIERLVWRAPVTWCVAIGAHVTRFAPRRLLSMPLSIWWRRIRRRVNLPVSLDEPAF